MNCPVRSGDKEIFIAYRAGNMAAEREAVFEGHLRACAECQRMAEAQTSGWSALDLWTPPDAPDNFDARVYARIEAALRRPWWKPEWNWSWRPVAPLALASALLVGVMLLKTPVLERPRQQPAASVERLDAAQLESALDDIEMLKQL